MKSGPESLRRYVIKRHEMLPLIIAPPEGFFPLYLKLYNIICIIICISRFIILFIETKITKLLFKHKFSSTAYCKTQFFILNDVTSAELYVITICR